MSSVSLRIDGLGVPHTFLRVTHPDGRMVEYGFGPADDSSVFDNWSEGEVDVSGPDSPSKLDHEFQFETPVHQLTGPAV